MRDINNQQNYYCIAHDQAMCLSVRFISFAVVYSVFS